MPKNDVQAWFMRLTGWGFLVGLIYGFWRWCAGYLIPFLIAAVLALALEPVVRGWPDMGYPGRMPVWWPYWGCSLPASVW